jgi:hypothetical protein
MAPPELRKNSPGTVLAITVLMAAACSTDDATSDEGGVLTVPDLSGHVRRGPRLAP